MTPVRAAIAAARRAIARNNVFRRRLRCFDDVSDAVRQRVVGRNSQPLRRSPLHRKQHAMVIAGAAIIQSADRAVILSLLRISQIQDTPSLNVAESRAGIGGYAVEDATARNIDSRID